MGTELMVCVTINGQFFLFLLQKLLHQYRILTVGPQIRINKNYSFFKIFSSLFGRAIDRYGL